MSHPEFVVVNPVLGRTQSPKALVLSFSSLSQRGVGRGAEPVRNAYTVWSSTPQRAADYPLSLSKKKEEKMAEVHLLISAIDIQFIPPETLF